MNTLELSDHLEIQDTVHRLAWSFDHSSWDALLDVLADEIVIDYTAMFGGQVETVPSTEQVQRWRAILEPLDGCQHAVSTLLVELRGDEASASANILAWLRRDAAQGAPLWHNGGTWHLGLRRTAAGWRITSLTAQATWIDGNLGVLHP